MGLNRNLGQLTEVIKESGGNIGIGTGTTPAAEKFHVNSGAGNVPALFESTDPIAVVQFKDNNSTGFNAVGGQTNDLIFYSNNNINMRLNSSGNLGIGTANATGQSSDNRVIQIYGAGFANRAQIHFVNANTGEGTSDGTFIGIDSNKEFFINNTEGATIFENSGSERMRINSSYVTTSNVYESFNAASGLHFGTSGSGGSFGFLKWDAGGSYVYLGNSYNAAFNKNLVITSSGNVLINTTTDTGQRLQVAGLTNIYSGNSSFQQSTNTASSGSNVTFNMGSNYGQGMNGDNIAGLVIISINEASTNIANGNAVYVGTIINPRGSGSIITQLSKVQGAGVTSFSVTAGSGGGNAITVNATLSSGATYRANLTFIGGGGTS